MPELGSASDIVGMTTEHTGQQWHVVGNRLDKAVENAEILIAIKYKEVEKMPTDETRSDEELAEDRAEEARQKQVLDALDALSKRYKSLVGELPPNGISIEGIQNRIREEMIRRDLRPYKL